METANSFSQQQQQKQIQTLAPQQLASLSLLSLPIMELETRIAEEMSRNPVLEFDESEPESSDQDDFPVDDAFGDEKTDDSSEPADANREDYEEYLDRMLDSGEPDTDSDAAEKKRQFMFDSIAAETSLQEAMLDQLRFADVSPAVRSCAEYVIGSLDENGWFRGTLPDAAQAAGSSLQEAEQALTLVQSFDPPGIAARDLKECLLLQAARASGSSPELETLIRDHLEELAHNKLPQIASAMKISMEKLNQLTAELRGFTPHPGKVLDQHREPYIVPEVTVVPDGDEFRLIEKEPPYGRLTISKDYQKMLENPALAAGDKAYLRSMIDSGKSLIHSIEQRKSTILRIAGLIVNAQYDFMKYGPRALKPMTMRQAADKLGLHETTVSRAVSGKYMLTPVGLFEFKYFFSGGFQSEEGEEVSARAIKNMIRDLVNAEDPAHPLSDSKLSNLLAEKGFEVARRTIAKYREELGITSSQLRKVY
ncbi:MAG: RNA polymerase factor sigma-54 [Lentisphaerae bacterium]|nr:RNA polymerase factor sigma-54 [Lentisphaerota bacterium]